jgi:Uma2 family endonuclease
MTTQPSGVRLTAQEYLRIERDAEEKSEFINGEMFGMGGASLRHTVIAANLVRELGSQLRNTPCVVASADLRVATDRHRHYTYPDVVVVCDPPQFVDGHFDTLTNPAFIAEVLSDSTEKYDRGAKSEHYRAMPTLSEYLLVSQDRVHVELYTRSNDGWLLHEWIDAGATVNLASLHCGIRIAEIYAKVAFET